MAWAFKEFKLRGNVDFCLKDQKDVESGQKVA